MAVTKISLGRQTDLNANSQKITSVLDPTSAQDAATKNYVDGLANGVDWKLSVRAATTAAQTLASDFENGDVIDGVTLVTGDRILIKDQASGAANGIYTVNASGAPTRATDADANAEVTSGLAVFVEEGTANADSGWTLTTNGAIVVGTTPLTFTQFTGLGQVTAGAGMTKSGNTLNVVAGDASLLVNADEVHVQLSGSTITTDGSGIKVGATVQLTTGFVDRETPSGLVNGSNVTYTLANTPVSGSEHVYLNGLLQEPGAGNDYTISGVTITYLTAPVSGDKIRVSYRK